jgi:NAD+ diphosphatase
VTAVNTFSGGGLDRMGPRRTDEAWLAERLADPTSRVVISTSDGVLVDDSRAPATVAVSELPAGTETVLLGVADDGVAVFGADPGPERAAALRPEASLVGLRDVAAMSALADANLFAHATGLLNWHRRHRFCANCGHPTEPREAGYVRTCPNCGAQHHPRTDPVVITLVTDGDRVLLGRNANWPERRFSCLAGFVEPGESLEEAVEREVGEEAAITVSDVRYVSSQPWPFPAQLMLGFEATYAGGDPHPHDGELQALEWFTREDLRRAGAGEGDVAIPPPLAIARRLMDGWITRS